MTCSAAECERDALWRGMCRAHYERWRRSRPGVREAEAAYDRRRRGTEARREAERKRNRARRAYLNEWQKRNGVGHAHRVRQYGGRYERVEPHDIFDRDDWRCQECGCKTEGTWPEPNSPTLDHITPIARGGDHVETNLQLLCFRCNAAKGARIGGRVE